MIASHTAAMVRNRNTYLQDHEQRARTNLRRSQSTPTPTAAISVAESTALRPLVGAAAARPGLPLLGGMPVTASCQPQSGAPSHHQDVTVATRSPETLSNPDRTSGVVLRV